MYEWKKEGDALTLYHGGKPLLAGVRPLIGLEQSEQPITLFLADEIESGTKTDALGPFRQYRIPYADETGEMTLHLLADCYERMMRLYIQVDFKNDVFAAYRTLTADAGIRLHIDSFGDVEGLLGNYLYCNWWTRPFFGNDIGAVPARTQSLVWQGGGAFHHLLPVADKTFKTELRGGGQGLDVLTAAYDGGYRRADTLAFVLATDADPFALPDRTAAAALDALGTSARPRGRRRYPETLEYLGWCSWDAFYHDVNEQGILDKGQEFAKHGLPVRWIMIDDGWSVTKDRCLYAFEADETKFPNGLAHTANELKRKYGVRWVGVWHAFAGYWNGIHPESELATKYKDNLLHTNVDRLLPHPDAGRGFGFWNAWHAYLQKQGIDFVKVDSQGSLIQFFKNQLSIGEAARGSHEALEASVGIHFDGTMINCMGMASENIFNRPFTAVSRNSDDFYPKKDNWFREHVMQNAYNAYYHGAFYYGDWDMFWTKHSHDANNALLRAVSGGPVYFSDRVGETDPATVWPLILQDGRVLRCDRPGLPTADCLLVNPNAEPVAMKLWNTSAETGIMAVFNIHLEGRAVAGTVSPSDIPALADGTYAVYDWFTGTARIMQREEKLDIELVNDGMKLYAIAPYDSGFAALGLLNKYIGRAAVESVREFGGSTVVTLKEGGPFGFVSERQPKRVLVDGAEEVVRRAGSLYRTDSAQTGRPALIEIVW